MFDGQFELDRPMDPLHKLYLQFFSESRRIKRNASMLTNIADPLRVLVKLPIGEDGCYFVNSFVNLTYFPKWSPKNNYLFSKDFKKVVITLLCIQKYYYPNIDKNIFFILT